MNAGNDDNGLQHTPVTDSVGAMLAAARKAQRLSVEEVARHLRLSVSQINALEADDYRHLPGAVFARGFARSYAKLVKLDPDALPDMTTGNADAPAVVSPMLVQARGEPFGEKKQWRPAFYVLAGLVLVGGLALYEFVFNDRAEPAATSVPPAKAVAAVAPEVPAQPITPPAPVVVETPAASQPVVTPPPENTARETPGGAREMHLAFSKDSWVEVRDGNGNILISKINLSGSEVRLNGAPPLSLVIGNAGGVRLKVDDKPIDLVPYATNDVARLRLE